MSRRSRREKIRSRPQAEASGVDCPEAAGLLSMAAGTYGEATPRNSDTTLEADLLPGRDVRAPASDAMLPSILEPRIQAPVVFQPRAPETPVEDSPAAAASVEQAASAEPDPAQPELAAASAEAVAASVDAATPGGSPAAEAESEPAPETEPVTEPVTETVTENVIETETEMSPVPTPPEPHAEEAPVLPAEPAVLSCGAHLARARQRKGWSIEDVVNATKIRRQILEAVERDDYEELPERVFVLGYVRSYASAVGVDPNDAVKRCRDSYPGETTPALEQELEKARRSYAWVAPLLAALVAAAAIWFVIFEVAR